MGCILTVFMVYKRKVPIHRCKFSRLLTPMKIQK